MIIGTPHGQFTTIRKDVVAISAVRLRRPVTHHFRRWRVGEITHIEHRKIPRSRQHAQNNCSAWGTVLATYNLLGNEIDLEPHVTNRQLFEQFRDVYCGRATYLSDAEWIAHMDALMQSMCEGHHLDFTPQQPNQV